MSSPNSSINQPTNRQQSAFPFSIQTLEVKVLVSTCCRSDGNFGNSEAATYMFFDEVARKSFLHFLTIGDWIRSPNFWGGILEKSIFMKVNH